MNTTFQPAVLFLDDDQDTRDLVSTTLQLAGMNVFLAETRSEAWELAHEKWFSLYLLDGMLPNGDAFQLCADLREFAPHTPIVFYSGLAFSKDIQRGFDAGATAYLTKPYEGDLARELDQLMKSFAPAPKSLRPYETVTSNTAQIMEFPMAAVEEMDNENIQPIAPRRVHRPGRFRTMRTLGGIF